jgi:hypothetical protein
VCLRKEEKRPRRLQFDWCEGGDFRFRFSEGIALP